METLMLEAVKPYINASFFGFDTVQDLLEYELTSNDIYSFEELETHKRVKRKEDAVMYVNVGGSPSDNACPSVADSSAVSLSQMAFLAMTVSIFTVVATVANNLNNNNNNINDNNLNFVQQKQNSLSMNQNIVNQINIDLPPPVPGKRSLRGGDLTKLLRLFQNVPLQDQDFSEKAMRSILSEKYDRECLGKQLCIKSLDKTNTLKDLQWIQSLTLLHLQQDENSDLELLPFISSIQKPENLEECVQLFQYCNTSTKK